MSYSCLCHTQRKSMARVAEEARFDVVILGASGFTGKYVVREFLQCMQRPSDGGENVGASLPPLSLALAGRSVAKLADTLAWATTATPSTATERIQLIEADALHPSSMHELCSRARVLVNCVGPCNLYGENIVAACVKTGVHYVDISGEAEFMEKMEAKYHDQALQTQALIVSGCGTVSIVSDIGLLYHLRQWPLQYVPSSVDAYVHIMSFKCYHAASAETGILALGNVDELARFRLSAPKKPKLTIPGCPHVDKDKSIHHERKIGLWASTLPICDRSVVRRTFWRLHGHPYGLPLLDCNSITQEEKEGMWKPIKPVHYRVFLGLRQFKWALVFSWAVRLMAFLARYTLGRKLLLKYPEIFTVGAFRKRGPTEEDTQCSCFEMWFVGRGYSKPEKNVQAPDVEVVTRVRGPEACYVTTAIGVVQSAWLCLHARSSLPIGGVLTTGAAFGGSNVQRCLEDRGLTFELVSTSVGLNAPPPTIIPLLPFKFQILGLLVIACLVGFIIMFAKWM